MSRHRIIVTRRWPAEVEAILSERFDAVLNTDDAPMDAAALAYALTEADAVLPTVTDKLDAAVFEAAGSRGVRARVLANFGVGVNHIDLEAAKAAGFVVTNTPGVLTDATADIAMTLLMMAARRAGEGERELRAGRWSGWRPTHLVGADVAGATLGVVGMGRIGKAMARRCHFGFGMNVIFHNRSTVADPEVQGARQAPLDEVLASADFVSLHCPGGDANRGLIGAEQLAAMKPTAFLINTARGDVVDEAALIEALRSGKIAGAGLDVFENEPYVSPALLEMENVALLPHLGSATRATRIAMGMKALANLEAVLEGRAPPDRVA